MTLLLVWLAATVGFVLGLFWAGLATGRIHAENEALRQGFAFVRSSIALDAGYRGLVRYIDRLLGEEAA